jgi:hypothetical protein
VLHSGRLVPYSKILNQSKNALGTAILAYFAYSFSEEEFLKTLTFMENLRVIRVEVIAPEKPLDVNTFSKNNPIVDFTIYNCLKISLCGYGQLRYPKILYVDLGLSVKTKNNCPQ